MEPAFTARGIVKEAYAIMKPKLWTAIGEFTILILVNLIFFVIFKHSFLLQDLLNIFFAYFMVVFGLSYMRNGSFSFDDLAKGFTWRRFAYFFVAGLLYGLAVLGGFILLVVPGIIVAVQMSIYRYLVIDKDMAPMPALKESVKLTKGSRWAIFRFMILAILLQILGLLCLLVGLLFTIPLALIGMALIYKKLSEHVEETAPASSEEEIPVIEAEVVEPTAA